MDQATEHLDSTGAVGPSVQLLRVTPKSKNNAWEVPSSSNSFYTSSDVSLFSSSLPVLRHGKLNFTDADHDVRSLAGASSKVKDLSQSAKGKTSVDDLGIQGVGVLLPDDEDELLAGIAEDFDLGGLPSHLEEVDEYDFFGSVGGLELDSDATDSISVGMSMVTIADSYTGNGISHYSLSNGAGTIAGEHPYGEHPSRTLFVRNINSNVEDSELRNMFEQYGDIRNLYTACKHRGFVMISYYDIRDARTAMRALQNKPLRRRKLDIHFSIPKDNPSDKDINQGTLVIFNLEPSVTNDDLRQIFGVYGEVKEIRETPHKRHHKFIEFYDVRAAEAALKALNKSDIAGKRIKLEPSRPGGARRNLMQQLTHDLEQDESRVYRHHGGSPMDSSPPGAWLQFNSPSDNNSLQALGRSPTGGTMSPIGSSSLLGLASVLPSMVSSPGKIAPIGKDQNRINQEEQIFSNSTMLHGGGFQHSHSYPDHNSGITTSSPGTRSSLGPSASSASGIGTLSGPQFLWGSPTPFMEHSQPSGWQSRGMGFSHPLNGQGQAQNILYSSNRGSFIGSPHNQDTNHVGSAPSGIPFERSYGYFPDSPETSFMSQVGFGNMGSSRNGGGLLTTMTSRTPINAGYVIPGNMPDSSSPSYVMMPSQRMGSSFFGNAPFAGVGSIGADGLVDRGRNRRVDSHGGQVDNKKQYQLDLDKIIKDEDTRTTLMIKNIPNKYTSKMLLAAIDENHKGTYDFLYLPIDFKNKCNVGYAFINMMSPSHIVSFYEAFNGKKWEKFNSEKVASLAYARIQGRSALVAHFQNSSLMNEDKRCRPILFGSDGLESIDQKLSQDAFQVSDMDMNTSLQEGSKLVSDSVEGSEKNKSIENSDTIAVPGNSLDT